MDIAADLHKAQRVRLPGGGFCLRGVIRKDERPRSRDDEMCTTSKVAEEIKTNVFKTQNSVYRVMSWLAPSKPTSEYTAEEVASWG